MTSSTKRTRIRSSSLAILFAGVLATLGAWPVAADQTADPEFNPAVSAPAFSQSHPKVLFDEAHHNFHTADGRYAPFVNLVRNDGFRVNPNHSIFTKSTLAGIDVLVIASASGPDEEETRSAFSETECEVIQNWVAGGGSLLLITDHAPHGKAAQALGQRFGIQMRGTWTLDPNNFEPSGNKGWLVFTNKNQLIGRHPIISGRNSAEAIHRITTFMGQSLLGPKDSVPLLQLADSAYDGDRESETNETLPAAGRNQGLALQFGKGRVVVLGEAAMLTAQYVAIPDEAPFRTGMSFPGSDNRQLALNIMHWLAGVLN